MLLAVIICLITTINCSMNYSLYEIPEGVDMRKIFVPVSLFSYNRVDEPGQFSLYDCVYKPTRKSIVCIFNTKSFYRTYRAASCNGDWKWIAQITLFPRKASSESNSNSDSSYLDSWQTMGKSRSPSLTSSVSLAPLNGTRYPTWFTHSLCPQRDHHQHTLAVEFPVPKLWPFDPRLHSMQMEVVAKSIYHHKVVWALKESIPVNLAMMPVTKRFYLVGCTSISDNYFGMGSEESLRKQVQILYTWLWYHFLHGFDHMVIYLDYDNPKFTAMILESLHKELLLEKITLFYSFPLNKPAFYYQQAHGNHCLYFLKDHTQWMVSFDVDEYIVPNPGDGSVTVKEAFSKYIDRFPDEPAITVQLMPQFWFNNFAIEDLLQGGTDYDRLGREANKYQSEVMDESFSHSAISNHFSKSFISSRQKCFFNVDTLMYFSVHEPTNPVFGLYVPNPEYMFLLHMKQFGMFRERDGNLSELVENNTFSTLIKNTFRDHVRHLNASLLII